MKAVVLLYMPCLKVNCLCEDIVYSYSEHKIHVNEVLKSGSTLLWSMVDPGS